MFHTVLQTRLKDQINDSTAIFPWITTPILIICNVPELRNSAPGTLILNIELVALLRYGPLPFARPCGPI